MVGSETKVRFAAVRKAEKYKAELILVGLLLIALILFGVSGCDRQKDFPDWTKDSASLKELTDYVDAVTRENGDDFIPEKDRIAVFDLDGTLMGETAPTYFDWTTYAYRVLDDPAFAGQATDEMIQTAEAIRRIPEEGIPEWLEAAHIRDNAKAFAGMTEDGFEDYIGEFLSRNVNGFENLTYAELFYRPMLEVVDYLEKNGFTVFIVSGTDTAVCRIVLQNVSGLPSYQIIGSVYGVAPDGQGDKDGLAYAMSVEDTIVRDGTYAIKNVKANKIKTICEHIGRQPVLAFGNSTGDFSMAMLTTTDNPYPSKAFFVLADDAQREYGDAEKAAETAEKVRANGWSTFSMKDDWKTIYKDGAVRTERN